MVGKREWGVKTTRQISFNFEKEKHAKSKSKEDKVSY